MVQVIETEDPRGRLSEMLGMSLGKGLGNGLNTFFANRSLESVLQDKSLENAPQSKKLEAIRSALMPYGEKGQEIFNQRMQIEGLEHQEQEQKKQEAKQKIKGKALGKYLKGGQLSEDEESLFTPQEFVAMHKARNPTVPKATQASQPINPEQLAKIQEVRKNPDFVDASPTKKYQMFTDNGVSKENAEAETKIASEEEKNQIKLINSAHKNQEKYLDDLVSGVQAADQVDMRLDQMLSLKDLPTPALATTMEALGIPPSLFSSDAETAEKLSIDLTKNIQQFYGNRILQSEFQAFLRSIPTLKNSIEGRKRIIENMKRFNDLKRLEYNTARAMELDYEEKNKPLPPSFRRNVFDKMKPEAEKLANEFKEANKQPVNAQAIPEGRIKVKNPEGKIGTLTLENYEKAIREGARYERIRE